MNVLFFFNNKKITDAHCIPNVNFAQLKKSPKYIRISNIRIPCHLLNNIQISELDEYLISPSGNS